MEEREKALESVLLMVNTRKNAYGKVSLQSDSPFFYSFLHLSASIA